MQKRKFDELISHFNRKVADMSIDQKYKMELLGMISAIGFAHEKELGTNLAEVGTDCISRQAAIDALRGYLVGKRCPDDGTLTCRLIENEVINKLPPIQSESLQPWEVLVAQAVLPQPEIIRCKDCKHWIPYDWMFSEVWQSKNIADYPEDEIGCEWSDMAMKANDFCSRAERREVTT